MNEVRLEVSSEEAKLLYRLLHLLPEGQEKFFDTYRQLQAHFFQCLTIDEVKALLEGGT